MEACALTKTQLNSLNYFISSSFRKIFNASSNEIVYLRRSMCNCSNVGDNKIIAYQKKQIFFAEILRAR